MIVTSTNTTEEKRGKFKPRRHDVYLYHVLNRRGQVVYVGITCNVRYRWTTHCAAAVRHGSGKRYCNGSFTQWLARQLSSGFMPKVVTVRHLTADVHAEEQKEIRRLRAQGAKLFNMTGEPE